MAEDEQRTMAYLRNYIGKQASQVLVLCAPFSLFNPLAAVVPGPYRRA
jgi:hypothetical protein